MLRRKVRAVRSGAKRARAQRCMVRDTRAEPRANRSSAFGHCPGLGSIAWTLFRLATM